jgi:hypothetical protein
MMDSRLIGELAAQLRHAQESRIHLAVKGGLGRNWAFARVLR